MGPNGSKVSIIVIPLVKGNFSTTASLREVSTNKKLRNRASAMHYFVA